MSFPGGVRMNKLLGYRWMAAAWAALVLAAPATFADTPSPAGYDGLVKLFEEWRAFEHPPLRDGAPPGRSKRGWTTGWSPPK
jgi:hypothetical protein